MQPELKSCDWHLRESRGMRKLNKRNGDADGHTLHLGPSPKVNNIQGAIWLRLEGGGVGVWGAEGGGEGCNEHKHMEKQIFPLPAAVMKANVSMRCVHA